MSTFEIYSLQSQNNVNIIKSKVLLLETWAVVADFGYPV